MAFIVPKGGIIRDVQKMVLSASMLYIRNIKKT